MQDLFCLTVLFFIPAGSHHNVVLKLDGSVWATGYNLYGQLGDGTTTSTTNFLEVMHAGAMRIAAGFHITLVLNRDNTLWATGSNKFDQFGDGSTDSAQGFVMVIELCQTALHLFLVVFHVQLWR